MEGERWKVAEKIENLQQRYLPSTWSRNANTAAVMTETDRGKDVVGAVFFAAQRDYGEKEADTPQCFRTIQNFHNQSGFHPDCLSLLFS